MARLPASLRAVARQALAGRAAARPTSPALAGASRALSQPAPRTVSVSEAAAAAPQFATPAAEAAARAFDYANGLPWVANLDDAWVEGGRGVPPASGGRSFSLSSISDALDLRRDHV